MGWWVPPLILFLPTTDYMATVIRTAGLPGRMRRRYSDANGSPRASPPGSVRYTDYAHQGVYVETPEPMSRRETEHDLTTSASSAPVGPRKWTQEDQDRKDKEARHKAIKELVNAWMERLQLISVITTFFAAIEAQLLGTVTPSSDTKISRISSASVATLSSALVIHSFAAILSFVAAFFLVRFRVHEASRQEHKAEHKLEAGAHRDTKSPSAPPGIWSSNPRLEQVGPLRRGSPPTHLLESCHTLCMVLAAVGFVLAMAGILCYVWACLPTSSIVLSTVAITLSLLAATAALVLPENVSMLYPVHVVEPA